MQYVRLGQSGLKVSRICLGMMSYGDRSEREWHLDEEQALPIVRAAVEAGVTFFDTADIYDNGASEQVTGRLLNRLFANRDDYVLATKVGLANGLSRKSVLTGIDASLRRLGIDYVDLYQIHRWDDETPIEETMRALHDVVQSGKACYIGASSMFAWQLAKAQFGAPTRFVSMQNHYNLVYREEEREMLPFCRDQGVGVIPYSPLARGLLARTTDSTRLGNDPLADEFYDESDLAVVQAVRAVAAERGLAPAPVALAWLLSRPGVTAPIVGATKLSHLQDAISSVALSLSTEEIKLLESPYRPHRILGHH